MKEKIRKLKEIEYLSPEEKIEAINIIKGIPNPPEDAVEVVLERKDMRCSINDYHCCHGCGSKSVKENVLSSPHALKEENGEAPLFSEEELSKLKLLPKSSKILSSDLEEDYMIRNIYLKTFNEVKDFFEEDGDWNRYYADNEHFVGKYKINGIKDKKRLLIKRDPNCHLYIYRESFKKQRGDGENEEHYSLKEI